MGALGDAGDAGLVSVLLSTRNRAGSLGAAVRSVLDQEGVDLELIVVNDGSTDDTVAVLEDFARDPRVRVVNQEESRGLPASLNRAASEARGALLARIDDDDRWIRRDKLKLQQATFEATPELVLLGTGYRDEARRVIRNPRRDSEIRKQMLFRCPFCHPSVVMRATAFHAAGGYDETMTYGEDWELWLRLGAAGRLGNLEHVCLEKAGGPGTLSARNFERQLGLAVSLASAHRSAYPRGARALGMHRFSRWFFRRFPADGAVHRAMSRAYRGVFSLERD